MADDRTFVLIGDFRDNITSHLENINNSINTLKQNLNAFGSKKGGFNDLTKSMGKVVSAHVNLKEQVKELRQEMRNSLPVLREYRREVGKAISANMHMAGGKRIVKKNNPYLQFLDQATRQTNELAKASQGVQLGRRMPRATGGGGGGGGGPRYPRTYTSGARGSDYWNAPSAYGARGSSPYSKERWGVSRDEQFAFGQTLGFTLGSAVSNGVVQGFQIGVGLMMQPFQYFAGAFGERVKDELDDLKAAGGLYSVSKRSANPFLANIDEAIQFQQKTNETFAKMAAALPGVTNDYVQVGKRLSDTAARIVSTDFEKARIEANRIRATEEGRKFYGGTITGTGAEQQRQVITTLLGELTKKTTLAGLGGRTGAGGVAGAYGLPGLTERMLSQEQVSIGQFQRYAAVFSDPAIADALTRNIDKINATQLNTIERFKAIQQLLDEVVTPDLIEKLRTSVDGIYQGLRSAIVDPDTGLFGLGRNFKEFGRRINQYGQYVNEANEVVTDLSLAAKEDLSIFEILRDIFVNAGQVLTPIVENLYLIFDPLKKVANVLMDARHYTAEFARTFNQYREGLKALSETPGMDFIKDTLDIRASLSAINNLLLQFGVIGRADFDKIAAQLTSKDLDLGAVLRQLIDKVLNSKIAYQIGDFIGEVIGTVLSELSKAVGFLAGVAGEDSSQLFKGLKKGFEEAGGVEAFRSVIQNVFKALINGIIELFKIAPLELSILSAIALLGPALVAAFSVGFANFIENKIIPAASKAFKNINASQGNDLGRGFFAKAREAYLLDKAKGTVDAGRAVTRAGAIASPSGVLNAKRIENKLFPGVALGMDPAMSIGAPRKAPSIPKPIASVKGMPVRILSVAKNAFTGAKGFVQRAGGFLGGLYGKTGAGGMTGLKNPFGMLGKFTSVLTIVTGVLSGAATFLQTGDIFKALGAAAGPVLGTILGTAILGPIGGVIGAWLFSQEAAVNSLASIFESVSQSLGGILTVLGDFGSAILQATGALFGAKSEGQALQQIFVLLKMALFPLTATLQLAEMGLRALYIAFLQIDKWVNATFQGGDRQGRIQDAIDKAQNDQMRRLMENQEYYASWSRREGQTGTLNGKSVTWKGGQWTDPATGKPVKGAGSQKPSPIFTQPSAPAPGAPAPVSATLPAPTQTNQQTEQLLTDAKQTATNVEQLNTKAATQVTQGVNIQKATEETKKNTTTANVTLGNIKAGLMAISNKLTGIQNAMLGDLNNIQAGVTSISSLLSSGSLKVKAEGMGPGNGPLGTAKGDLGRAQNMASQYGLSLTSWFRPGDKGYHGVGRAMDFSNGVSTPQQMEFAQAMVNQYGTSLKELIYTPLGFGIKDGTRVPLSYWGAATNVGHYDHVHVAFAEGFNQGRMFTSQSAAAGWENSMVPGSVKVASITGNSAEGFGGNTYGDINVTVNAGSVNDPDELASLVAFKISEAVSDARAASLFV